MKKILLILIFVLLSQTAHTQNLGTSSANWITVTNDPPTLTCSATSHNGVFYTSSTPNLYQCSNVTGTYQWNKLTATGGGSNTVTASSPGAGLARFAGGTQTVTSAEISGDCTTSGSNAINCTKTSGVAFTGYATAVFVADTTITVGSSVAFTANTCSGVTGTANTASTVSMTNLTTSMTLQLTPTSDVKGVTGWGPGSGGQLYFQAWPSSSGTVSYYVCNPTSSSITTSASTTWNVSAK
jgi:hypothetical protein